MMGRCRFQAIVCVAVLASAGLAGRGAAPPAGRKRPETVKGPVNPALIASGKGYYIHAVPLRPDQSDGSVGWLLTPLISLILAAAGYAIFGQGGA